MSALPLLMACSAALKKARDRIAAADQIITVALGALASNFSAIEKPAA
jgi:hypothetical protein